MWDPCILTTSPFETLSTDFGTVGHSPHNRRMCVWERERESVCYVCVRESVWERECVMCVRERVCVCERERVCVWESVCVCVRERERERVFCERESVCVWERERGDGGVEESERVLHRGTPSACAEPSWRNTDEIYTPYGVYTYIIVSPRFARRWRTCGCCGHLEPQRGRLSSLTRVWSSLASLAELPARESGEKSWDQPPRPPLLYLPPFPPSFPPSIPLFLPPPPPLLLPPASIPADEWHPPCSSSPNSPSSSSYSTSSGYSDNTTVSSSASTKPRPVSLGGGARKRSEPLPGPSPAVGTTRRTPGSRRAARWWAAGPRGCWRAGRRTGRLSGSSWPPPCGQPRTGAARGSRSRRERRPGRTRRPALRCALWHGETAAAVCWRSWVWWRLGSRWRHAGHWRLLRWWGELG